MKVEKNNVQTKEEGIKRRNGGGKMRRIKQVTRGGGERERVKKGSFRK